MHDDTHAAGDHISGRLVGTETIVPIGYIRSVTGRYRLPIKRVLKLEFLSARARSGSSHPLVNFADDCSDTYETVANLLS